MAKSTPSVVQTHSSADKSRSRSKTAHSSVEKPANSRPHQSASRMRLLKEIKSLGGDATDLDLLEGVLSGSECEDNDDIPQNKVVFKPEENEAALLSDLMAFMSGQLKMDPSKSTVEAVSDDEGEESQDEPVTFVKETQDKPATFAKETQDKPVAFAKDSKTNAKNKTPPKPDSDSGEDEDDEDVFNTFNDQEVKQDTGATYGQGDEDEVQKMLAQMIKGKKPVDKLQSRLLIEPSERWWELSNIAEVETDLVNANSDLISQKFVNAENLWKEEISKFEKLRQSTESRADKDFISTVLKSGTTTDKLSALTLQIQEAPLHRFTLLNDHLICGMARKKSRREALVAIDSIKDLLLNSILPDRKLKYFVDQPVLSKKTTREHLILWYFEDALKKAYFSFIQLIEELTKDPLPHIKNKMLSIVFDLLTAKPEQEQNLLSLLVNKLGDLDKKIASKSVHLLAQLIQNHPAMKSIVIGEIERLLFRSNIAERAQYYAVTFLNQIVLSRNKKDSDTANMLIDVYFKLFEILVHKIRIKEEVKDRCVTGTGKKHAKKGKNSRHKQQAIKNKKDGNTNLVAASQSSGGLEQVDGVDAKMMAALLTGVNRAFPYAELDNEVFESHLNILFKITHVATFNTCIQSLTLILQVQSSREMVSDRFYRALYDTLLDNRLFEASKQSMYLNLLFKAMKTDASPKRVRSFVKRIVQVCGRAQIPLICGSLFLIGELAKLQPGLWTFITQPEEHDEERFVDASEPAGEDVTMSDTSKDEDSHAVDSNPSKLQKPVIDTTHKYDGRKRDPLYTNADQVCLWELCIFASHFHPTVSLYARTLLSGSPIVVPATAKNYDPLQNHTLSRFLDRFVFKAPKKVTSLYHGSSLMQPRVSTGKTNDSESTMTQFALNSGNLLSGSQRKKNVIYVDQENPNVLIKLDDTPANLVQWSHTKIDQVAPDDLFYYKFFVDRSKKAKQDDEGKDGDHNDLDSNQDIDEEEAWNAMQKSSGFPQISEGLGSEDEDEDFLPENNDEDVQADGDDDDMAAWANGKPSKQEEDDDMMDTLISDEGDDFDEDPSTASHTDKKETKQTVGKRGAKLKDRLASKAVAMGYSGDYFAGGMDDFANADDFSNLLDRQDTEESGADEVEEESERKRKRKSNSKGRTQKKRLNVNSS
ncbi:hypothetical protein BDV3_005343 [Batrachochytrium dendrobatidis]